jgi:hypothetical protein
MILGFIALLMASDTPHDPATVVKPKLVCREGDTQTGSHMHASRRCLTVEEWQLHDEQRDRIPITARVTADPEDAARAATRPH